MMSYVKTFATKDWISKRVDKNITLLVSSGPPIDDELDSVFHLLKQSVPKGFYKKVLIMVNYEHMYNNFASLSYDTLFESDYSYLYNYYGKRKMILGHCPCLDKNEPILSINATEGTAPKELGIKIVFNSSGKRDWLAINRMLKYGCENIEKIERHQKEIIIPYSYDGYFVRFQTIDTNDVKKIMKGKVYIRLGPEIYDYWILAGMVGIVLISVFLTIRKQKGLR